jgi:hypothetical protein
MQAAIVGLVLVLSVAAPSGADGQGRDKAMTVFVTMGQVADAGPVTEAVRQEHSAAISAAQTRRKDLEKTLKAQHGSKRDRWPPEAEQQMQDAEEAVALATSNWTYRTGKKERVADSVEDIRNSMIGKGTAGRKENIVVVSSRDEAQLVVEVDGRRSAHMEDDDPFNDEFWVRVLITRGPKLTEKQFAAVPRTYRFLSGGYPATYLGTTGSDMPQWRFETHGLLRWSTAANGVAILLEDFIAKNYQAMMSAR